MRSLSGSMQTNAVIQVRKNLQGRRKRQYFQIASILHQREGKYRQVAALRLPCGSVLIAYLALSAVRTMLPFKVRNTVRLINIILPLLLLKRPCLQSFYLQYNFHPKGTAGRMQCKTRCLVLGPQLRSPVYIPSQRYTQRKIKCRMGTSRLLGRMGNKRLIIGLPPARCI